MLLLETAFAIVNGRIENNLEDQIEAYQYINDYGFTDKLNDDQRRVLWNLIETGSVQTDEFQI